VLKSGRNIPRVSILEAAKASTYEILNGGILLLQKSSVDVIQKTFAN
jgi:large subunit ribosomal protein L4